MLRRADDAGRLERDTLLNVTRAVLARPDKGLDVAPGLDA